MQCELYHHHLNILLSILFSKDEKQLMMSIRREEDYKSSYIIHIKRCKHGPNVGVRRIRQVPQAKELLELVKGEKSRWALGHEFSVPMMTLTSL